MEIFAGLVAGLTIGFMAGLMAFGAVSSAIDADSVRQGVVKLKSKLYRLTEIRPTGEDAR